MRRRMQNAEVMSRDGLAAKLGYSWPPVSTSGSRVVAFKLRNILTRIDLGKVMIDPRSSLVEPSVLASKERAEGCRT